MAKKVEQLSAQTTPAGSALIVISEAGVSKKSTIDQITQDVRDDLSDEIDAKATPNPPITAATRTKISYDTKGFVTGGTNATTADINDTTDRRYVTDLEKTFLSDQIDLFDVNGNLVLPTPGAGVIMQDATGHPFLVNVDSNGQVIDMSGFVSVKNGQFFLRGHPYQGVGVNYYPLAWSGKSSIISIFDYAIKQNINEFRFWLFDQLSPSDSGGNFHFLDYPLNDPNLFDGIVATPDFEADSLGWTLHAEFTRDAAAARSGGFGIKQVSPSGFNGMETAAFTTVTNTNYTLTFWYKRVSQAGFGPLLQIKKGSDGTQLLDGGLLEQTGPDSQNGWQRKQVRFNSGSETSITIRILNFGGSVTTYYDDFWLNVTGTPILSPREDQFRILDYVADEARKRGIKLVPSFADNTSNYNTKLTYVNWANSIYGAGLSTNFPYIGFFTSTYAKQIFKDNIASVLNRRNTINGVIYKEDPTFKAWELGNELRLDRDDPSGYGTTASANMQLLSGPSSWTAEMSAYIKVTLGAKQLVTFGSMSHEYEYRGGDSVYNGSYYGVSAKMMAQLPHIHYLDFHFYPTQDALQPELYPLGELDIVSYGQKVANRPPPIHQSGTNVTSKVITLNEATVAGDILVPHVSFSGTPGSTPTITDSAGNTYTVTSNSSTVYHFNGPQTIGGVTSFTVSWTTPRNIDVKVDENGGRENFNNARSRAGLETQLLDWINTGLAYGKPSNISEHGYSRDLNNRYNYHYPLQPRLNAFTALFDYWFDHGGGQINLWSATIVGGGSYSINLGERDGQAITDNSDDTNINTLLRNTNEKFHHHSPKSELDDDTRYTDSELTLRDFDGDYQGITQLGTSGEALSFGNLIYLDEFTSLWKKAGALLTTSRDRKLGMCVLASSGTGKSIKILQFGNIRADSIFPTFIVGRPVFMSETAGLIATSKPTTTGAVHRVVGYADTADQLYFQPDGHFSYVS